MWFVPTGDVNSRLTAFGRQEFLGWGLGDYESTIPQSLWFGLMTSTPIDVDTGTTINEVQSIFSRTESEQDPSGEWKTVVKSYQTSYRRVSYPFSVNNGPEAAWVPNGQGFTTTKDIEWPPVGEKWPAVVAWGMFDASTDGNMLAYGKTPNLGVLDSGDIVYLPAGGLSINFIAFGLV